MLVLLSMMERGESNAEDGNLCIFLVRYSLYIYIARTFEEFI